MKISWYIQCQGCADKWNNARDPLIIYRV